MVFLRVFRQGIVSFFRGLYRSKPVKCSHKLSKPVTKTEKQLLKAISLYLGSETNKFYLLWQQLVKESLVDSQEK